MKRPLVAGNWKMNHGPRQAAVFFTRFLERWAPREDRTVLFFPPAVSLAAARQALETRTEILLGVQNVHAEPSGAFTGEISAPMAAEGGATWALVGHSERRHLFGESTPDTVVKVRAVLGAGLAPMLCVGETLDQRRAGQAEAVVEDQLQAVLADLPAESAASFAVAYEPVWAIGTGVTATPADAGAMHAFVRQLLLHHLGEEGRTVPILYGGSVKPDNAAELLRVAEVDGVLVGGASLDPSAFASICAAGG